MSAGDYQGAAADLEIAAEQRPRDPWLQLRLATCFQELRNPARARKHFELALSAKEELNKANSHEDLIEFNAALQRYQKRYLPSGN